MAKEDKFVEIKTSGFEDFDPEDSILEVGRAQLKDRPEEHEIDDEDEDEKPFFDYDDEEDESTHVVTEVTPEKPSELPVEDADQKEDTSNQKDSRANKRIRDLVAEKNKLKEELQKERIARLEYEKNLAIQTKSGHLSQKEALNTTIKSINTQMLQALEEGDHAKVLELQDSLLNAKMKLAGLEYEVKNIGDDEQITKKYEEEKKKVSQTTADEPDPRAMEWVEAHPEFKTDPLFQANALMLDKMLISEGIDPTSDEYYTELDARLSSLFPKYFGKTNTNVVESKVNSDSSTSEKSSTQSKPKQAVVAGASRTPTNLQGSTQAGSSNKVSLNKYDIELAEQWGMTLKEFAKAKQKIMEHDNKDPDEYISIF